MASRRLVCGSFEPFGRPEFARQPPLAWVSKSENQASLLIEHVREPTSGSVVKSIISDGDLHITRFFSSWINP